MNKNQNAAINNNSKGLDSYESEKFFDDNDKTQFSEELKKRESELNIRELKFMAKQLLSQKGLPAELADILKLDDEKSVVNAVEMLAKLGGVNEKDNKLKVFDEKKLPEAKTEEKYIGELRKAFGLR